ncbi:MAG TPA: response regulator [Vineibacter sp.]|nr:response regulator [Vineibacter sp.]
MIDDEVELLGEIVRFLQRRGHKVHAAAAFAGGMDLIDGTINPDVLITDVRMPGGNGLDLARRTRARHPDCRIVIMTGHLDQSQIGPAEELGAVAVLFKPFSFGRLLTLVTGTDERRSGRGTTALPLGVAAPAPDAV